ncbi:MAG: hypothetical protein ACE5FE_10790 [Acidiferrobacterales bacterium]
MLRPALAEALDLGAIIQNRRKYSCFFTGLAAISSRCDQSADNNLNLPADYTPANRVTLESKFLMHA